MQQIQFISTTPEDLAKLIDEIVKGRFDDLMVHFEPKAPTEYLTRNKVAEMLSIDLSTVHNWTKKGHLTAHQIGGRIFYRRQEVEDAIVKLNK